MMSRTLADYWRYGRSIERAGFLIAAILLLSGLFHLGVLVGTGGSWVGPLSWRKPTTFGLSFGLTLATITWTLSLLSLGQRTRTVLLGVFGVACVLEVAVITTQAWRRLPSHFTTNDMPGLAVNAAMGAAAALGAVSIVATMFIATITTFREQPGMAASMRLALRMGFVSLMCALAIGVIMLARGMVLARVGGDLDGAFTFTGRLKPGHAATMHGVLVLPALAWLLSFTERPERFRHAVVRMACFGYALFAVVVVAASFTGTLASTIAVVGAVAGGFLLAGSGARASIAVARHPLADRKECVVGWVDGSRRVYS